MFLLWLHFQLEFLIVYQNIHAYYLPKDDLWQGKKSEHCLLRCLKQFQYCENSISSHHEIGYYLLPDDTSVSFFIFLSNNTI